MKLNFNQKQSPIHLFMQRQSYKNTPVLSPLNTSSNHLPLFTESNIYADDF